jgi:alpha-methylacyl-CoA racemase
MAKGPLSGALVIDFAGTAPGPFCGMLLSDLGADVIRVPELAEIPRTKSRAAAAGR